MWDYIIFALFVLVVAVLIVCMYVQRKKLTPEPPEKFTWLNVVAGIVHALIGLLFEN